MASKHPNTERWGGPGASHEDRSKPAPEKVVKDPDDPDRFDRHSSVSGGGGERDVHRAHSAKAKRDFEANGVQRTLDRGR